MEDGGETAVEEPEGEAALADVSLAPNENADPQAIVDAKIPQSVRDKYEIISYRNAAVILSEARLAEFSEIIDALNAFSLTTDMLLKAGGNESDMPKIISKLLRPLDWHETVISADLDVTLSWRGEVRKNKNGKPIYGPITRTIKREKYLDGHKIDYVKGKVAFDMEWNSKDQTFDRDLYAMSAFFQSGAIDVGVLVTRSMSLNEIFRSLGIMSKYGASTTWMGKLIYRLNAGRNGGCPVLAVGITPAAVSDWTP